MAGGMNPPPLDNPYGTGLYTGITNYCGCFGTQKVVILVNIPSKLQTILACCKKPVMMTQYRWEIPSGR